MKTPDDPKAALNSESCSGQDASRKARKLRQKKPLNKPPSNGEKSRAEKVQTRSVEEVNLSAPEQEDEIEVDLKVQLSSQELKFITFRFVEGMTIENAMKSAGYEGYHPSYLWKLGKKIIQKYESSAGDHRKIFRSIGAGETAVAEGLLKLATTAKSEMVRLNAWTVIAKCLGLQKEVVDVQTGISIIIQQPQPAPSEPSRSSRKPALALADKKALPGPTPIEILK